MGRLARHVLDTVCGREDGRMVALAAEAACAPGRDELSASGLEAMSSDRVPIRFTLGPDGRSHGPRVCTPRRSSTDCGS